MMASIKRATNSIDQCGASTKKTKVILTLETKLDIIERRESGQSAASLGRMYSVNESSIRTIVKNAEKIRSAVASCSVNAKTMSKVRHPLIGKMESMLALWMEDQTDQMVPLTYGVVRTQALKIYNLLDQEEGGPSTSETFLASKGWYDRFTKRHMSSRNIPESFPEELKAVIEAEGYLPQQVFNADETGLFWKKMPKRTFLSHEEKTAPGFKSAKDMLTLLLCGNAEGDFKCKPFLVYHSQNPRALKGLNQHTLPVHWRWNKNAWMTAKLFDDWFSTYFCVEVEKYCLETNIPFKVLLILDNAPGHSLYLPDLHPNVRVMFLPTNAVSVLQPMNQGPVMAFKIYYLKHTLNLLLDSTGDDGKPSVREFWRGYNILHGIMSISSAWDAVDAGTLNSSWYNLWKEGVKDVNGFFRTSEEVSGIVSLGRRIGGEGFNDLEDAEVMELLESHHAELSVEDLMELTQYGHEEDDDDGNSEETSEMRDINVNSLASLFSAADHLAQIAVNMDPNLERSLQFGKNLNSALSAYHEIYKEKQRRALVIVPERQWRCVPPPPQKKQSRKSPSDH